MKVRLTNEGTQGSVPGIGAVDAPATPVVSRVAPAVVDAIDDSEQAGRFGAVGVSAAIFEPAPALDAAQLAAARNFAASLLDLAECCA